MSVITGMGLMWCMCSLLLSWILGAEHASSGLHKSFYYWATHWPLGRIIPHSFFLGIFNCEKKTSEVDLFN